MGQLNVHLSPQIACFHRKAFLAYVCTKHLTLRRVLKAGLSETRSLRRATTLGHYCIICVIMLFADRDTWYSLHNELQASLPAIAVDM